MNKKDLFKNLSSAINVSALSGMMAGKRVLVLNDAFPGADYSSVRSFFDICIAVGEDAAKYCGTPDILILSRENPHVNGVLNTSLYDNFRMSLLCITMNELSVLLKIPKYHSNYVLSWQPTSIAPGASPVTISGIPYGLSADDPGLHLALIGGATDVYAYSLMGNNFVKNVNELMSQKSGYIPTNILRPQRPQFIDEARFIQQA